jgi:AraC-like DNA-binding protein
MIAKIDAEFFLTQLIGALPILLSVFFGLQLILNKSLRKKSSYYLSVFLFMLVIVEGVFFFSNIEFELITNVFLTLMLPALLLLSPLIYIFLAELNRSLMKKDGEGSYYKHFILPGIALTFNAVCFIFVFAFPSGSSIHNFFKDLLVFSTWFGMGVVFVVQNIFYLVIGIKKYYLFHSTVTDIYSYKEGVTFQWMKVFLAGYTLFFIGLVIVSVLDLDNYELFLYLDQLAFVGFIGGYGIRKMELFYAIEENSKRFIVDNENQYPNITLNSSVESNEQNEKKTAIDEEKFIELRESLLHFVEIDKAYLNSKLSLYDVAEKLGTNYKYVSHIINNSYNKNFLTFINEYRITESKKLLVDKENSQYTIEAIARMAGFHSKSSFNTAFKKITGQTPSEFRKLEIG